MILNSRQLISAKPEEIVEFLREKYTFEIPVGIDSEIAMRRAGNLLAEITNAYTYLASVNVSLSIYTKFLKNNCTTKPKKPSEEALQAYEEAKTEYEEMRLRKSVVEAYVDILKQQYNCVSRMITVKIEADRELKMSESK